MQEIKVTEYQSFTLRSDVQALNDELRMFEMTVKLMPEGRNSMLYAIIDQMQIMSLNVQQLRADMIRYMTDNKQKFMYFVPGGRSIDLHISLMQSEGTVMGQLELYALANMLGFNLNLHQRGQSA